MKELAVLKQETARITFSRAIEIFDKIRQVLRFLIDYLSWIAMGGRDNPVQRDEMPDYDSCI